MNWVDLYGKFSLADDASKAEIFALCSNRLAVMDDSCFSCEEDEHSELKVLVQKMSLVVNDDFMLQNGYVMATNEDNISEWVKK